MHTQKKWIKAAVLSAFVLLMTGFVAYRSGFLDQYLYSANGGNSLSNLQQSGANPADTGRHPVDSSRNRQMMSGSKSLILTDLSPGRSPSAPDTGKLKIVVADSVWKRYQDESSKERIFMSSSKSGHVIRPDHPARKRYPLSVNGKLDFYTSPQIDSLLLLNPVIDSLQPVRPLQPDTPAAPRILPSTKSGGVFYPSDLKKKKAKKQKD